MSFDKQEVKVIDRKRYDPYLEWDRKVIEEFEESILHFNYNLEEYCVGMGIIRKDTKYPMGIIVDPSYYREAVMKYNGLQSLRYLREQAKRRISPKIQSLLATAHENIG